MAGLQFIYAVFLRLAALGLMIGAGCSLMLPGFAEQESLQLVQRISGKAHIGAFAIGIFLLVPWWLPCSLRRPSRPVHLIWAAGLAGASWLGASMFIDIFRTLETKFGDGVPMAAAVEFAWINGAIIGTALIGVLVAKRADMPAEVIQAEPRSVTATKEAFVALSLHRALMALGGIVFIVSGVAIFLTMGRDPAVAAFYATHDLALNAAITSALCVIAGVTLLTPRLMPRFVHRPSRWFHFPGIGLYLVALSSFAMAPLFIPAFPGLVGLVEEAVRLNGPTAAEDANLDLVQAGTMTTVISCVSFFGLILTSIAVISRPVAYDDRGPRPDPKDPARAIPEARKKPVRIQEKKLPALGAAMKLYVGADWLILRLMGLSLMATAYMLWTLIQTKQIDKAALMSHGLDPMQALYIYAGIGAILGIPFLLPRSIARPQHVFFGLIKAALLVAAAYALILPVDVAIVSFTPDIYHATLIATVPKLFKAISGVAVTSVLLIAFFRQLNTLPAVDYKGDPKIHLSADQLHELRKARMGT